MKTLRLLLAVTGHGYGHLAQCAPVVAALRARVQLELLVRSSLPRDILAARLGPVAAYLPSDAEFGAVMQDAATIDQSATWARYQALHARLESEVTALADDLGAHRCDGVLSNVSYIATAAARRAGVPSVLFSSLAWHEIAAACFAAPAALVGEMLEGYRQATRVLCLQPGLPFAGLPATPVAQPIARLGHCRRDELAGLLRIEPERPLGLLAFGGIMPGTLPPVLQAPGGYVLLGPGAWARHGVVPVERVLLPFDDLIASVDVVVSKPGYGIVTELGCAGTASVLMDRPGWPEQPFLVDWLQRHARCLVVPGLDAVDAAVLRDCLALPPPAAPRAMPGGERAVAEAVLAVV